MRTAAVGMMLWGAVVFAQEDAGTGVLQGRVMSRGTRDPAPLASLSIDDGEPIEAGDDGSFALTLTPGPHQVRVQAPGHQPGTFTETIEANVAVTVDYRLVRHYQKLYETVVRTRSDRAEQARVTLTGAELTEVAGTSNDPLRVVLVLPGVAAPMSGLAFPVVRGAVPAATGTFLDGVQMPMLYHLFGGPSVIHPELIDQIDFFPSNAPARFSRVTGGVVAASTTRPRDDRFHMSLAVDVLNSSAFLEIPIPQTKTHVTLAGRISYTGGMISLLGPLISSDVKPVTEFFDYQARIEQKIGAATLRLLVFGSSDVAGFTQPSFESSSFLTSRFHRADLRGLIPLGPGLLELGATAGEESGGLVATERSSDPLLFRLGRTSVSGRARYRLERGAWQLKVGLDAERQASSLELSVDAGTGPFRSPSVGVFAGGFVEGAYVGERLEAVLGVRLDNYVHAGHTSKLAADPRLDVRFAATKFLKLNAGVGLFHQPPMLLVSLPVTDMAELHNGLQEVIEATAGTDWKLPLGMVLSVSGYYHHITQARERSLIQFFSGLPTIDDTLNTRRRGRAYGLEVMLRAPQEGRFFGWLTYSLMRSERLRRYAIYDATQDVVGQGEGMLPFAFDQTHVVNATAGFQLPRGWKIGATVHVNSGRPETGEYSSRTMRPNLDGESWVALPLNEVDRLPPFFRLDARVSKLFVKDQYTLELYLDVLNLLGRDEVVAWNYLSTDVRLSKVPTAIPLIYPALGFKGSY